MALLSLCLASQFVTTLAKVPQQVSQPTATDPPVATPPASYWRPANLPLGYIITFTVFNRGDVQRDHDQNLAPNYRAAAQAVYAWADQKGFTHPDEIQGMAALAPTQVQVFSHGGGSGSSLKSTSAIAALHIDDASLAQELADLLRHQPGVAEPEIGRESDRFGLGGLRPEMEGKSVIIDGTAYAFPEDFETHEAQDLYWIFSGTLKRGTTYRAFPGMLMLDPVSKSRRFPLGDIVRISLDDSGNLTIDTVVKHWNLPTGSGPARGGGGGGIAGGFALTFPEGFDESSIDPVEELSRSISPLPSDKSDQRYQFSMDFQLIPEEVLLTSGAAGITPDMTQLSNDVSKQLERAVDQWIEANPGAKRSLIFGDRARSGAREIGNAVFVQHVHLTSDSLEEIASFREYIISNAPGAPAPSERVFDRVTRGYIDPPV
jgi:hypothetical protein